MHTPSLTDAVRRELLVRSEVTESTHRFGGVTTRHRSTNARVEPDRGSPR